MELHARPGALARHGVGLLDLRAHQQPLAGALLRRCCASRAPGIGHLLLDLRTELGPQRLHSLLVTRLLSLSFALE